MSTEDIDIFLRPKNEICKYLYTLINWEEIMNASGGYMRHRSLQLIEKSQDNLGVVLDNRDDAKELAKMLLKVAEISTTNTTVQQFVFTKMEEILGLGLDFSDSDTDAFGSKHAKLFTTDGQLLNDTSLVKALSSRDSHVQKSASCSLACMLSICDGNSTELVNWIISKLISTSEGAWEMALPALCILIRAEAMRKVLLKNNVIPPVVSRLKQLGLNGNSQLIYELTFVLWTLSFGEVDFHAFLSTGTIPLMINLFVAAPSRKIVRMAVATLKNLSSGEQETILNEMLTAGLLKHLDSLMLSNASKQFGDEDMDEDIKILYSVLQRNYRELSTFDRWATEVKSGALRWGIVHTEKFWKENARFMDHDDFSLLKELIQLLNSADPGIVCVALYDIGEFTRFYPNGRVIVSRLGAKDIVMKMISHQDPEIQRHTLQCISKIMVTNWEFLR